MQEESLDIRGVGRSVPWPPRLLKGAPRAAAATSVGIAALVLVAAVWSLLQLPVDVPDTSSPPAGNAIGSVNSERSVGQTFVPRRDGLHRVSVVLAVGQPTDGAEIAFQLSESPGGEPLRTVKRPISSLPRGDAIQFRPGSLTERWYTFDFEPIRDSASRRLYFSLEGKGVPHESTVKVLMFYHNGYKLGQAHLDDEPTNAHFAFRTHSQGRLADLVAVLGENLTAGRPGPLSNPATYLVLGLLYLLLAVGLLWAARRAVKAKT